jgi:hypothetical protein
MTNKEKWQKKLRGLNNYEAFQIIWSPKRSLTGKQRQALVKLHQEINNADNIYKQKQLTEKWSDPKSWIQDSR